LIFDFQLELIHYYEILLYILLKFLEEKEKIQNFD